MNPYDDIDHRRKQPGNFKPPGPVVNLDNRMESIWNNCYYLATNYVIDLVSHNKPSPNTIYTFNVLSQGNPPFCNEDMCQFVCDVSVVYMNELVKGNANGHNEQLFRDILMKMGEAYQWAIITADRGLQSMVGNDQNLKNKAIEAAQWYKNIVASAVPNNNGWSSSNNNGGWSSNTSSGGWNDSSSNGWSGSSVDVVSVNDSWGGESGSDNSWGKGSHTTEDTSTWGGLGSAWGDNTPAEETQQKENKAMKTPLNAIQQALAEALAESQPKVLDELERLSESAKQQSMAVEEIVKETPATESVWTDENWGATGDWGDGFGDGFGDIADEATDINALIDQVTEEPAIVEEPSFPKTLLALANERDIPIIPGQTDLPITLDNISPEEYLDRIFEMGGCPIGSMVININGEHFLVMPAELVRNYTPNLHDDQRRNLPAKSVLNYEPWYVVDKDMELIEIMLDISDQDIYKDRHVNANVTDTKKELTNLVTALATNQDNPDELVTLGRDNCEVVGILIKGETISDNHVYEIAEKSFSDTVNAVVAQVTKDLTVISPEDSSKFLTEAITLDLVRQWAIEKPSRSINALQRNILPSLNTALRLVFGEYDELKTFADVGAFLKDHPTLREVNLQNWLAHWFSQFKITVRENNLLTLSRVSDCLCTETLGSIDEYLSTEQTTAFRIPLVGLDVKIPPVTKPLRFILGSGVTGTFYGIDAEWIYVTASPTK